MPKHTAGQRALSRKVKRIRDPGSVVRRSEVKRARSSRDPGSVVRRSELKQATSDLRLKRGR